jgi:S1-C subfamily serine protease
MGGVSKTFVLAVTTVSITAILAILFAWMGPGIEGVTSPAAAAALFDEEQVHQIYDRVSPAIAEVSVDQRTGDSHTQIGFGSGFLVDQEGHIATNNHVVEGGDRVRVSFPNGAQATASVLGRTPANDLALLKVDPAVVAGIEPVELGDSSLVRPGQLAIAIGSPFQLEGSITVGVISGIDRSLPSHLGRSIFGVIQTDALIGPGNSGGPLLNSAGQVVGVNTAIEIGSTFTGRPSAGFAVPINSLVNFLPMLKAGQVVRPPWLGVSVTAVDQLLVERLELPVDEGVYVTGVMPDSPADEAGIVPSGIELRFDGDPTPEGEIGDIIVAINEAPVDSVSDLITEINRHQPGNEITLTVVRNGNEMEIPVTLGEWPEEQIARANREFFRRPHRPDPPGFRIFPELPPEFPREFRIPNYRFEFSIPGFSLPELLPDVPQR